MNEQPQLPLWPDLRGPQVEAFEEFHADNPLVYERLLDLALELRRHGRERYGIAGLFEVLRWQGALYTTDEEYKLNNNHKSFYARLLMEQEPELKDFFATRTARADEE